MLGPGWIAAQDDSEKPSPQEDASVCSVAADFFLGHAKARLFHNGQCYLDGQILWYTIFAYTYVCIYFFATGTEYLSMRPLQSCCTKDWVSQPA